MAENTTSEKIGDARGPGFGDPQGQQGQQPQANPQEQDFGDALEEAIDTDPSLKMEKKIKDKLSNNE